MLRALHRQLSDSPPSGHPPELPYQTFQQRDALPLTPHKVTKLVFDLLPTSYQFKKGHRIRVALAGGDKDHFATLPEENLVLTVLRSELYSSRVDLPVVE